jgi:hypothetical protein
MVNATHEFVLTRIKPIRGIPIFWAFAKWHGLCCRFSQEEFIQIMSILNFRNTLKGLALVSVFTVGLILTSGTTANAQYRQPNYGGYGNNGGYYGRNDDRYRRNERKEYEKGYKRGYNDGKHDAKSRNGRYGNNRGGIFNGGYNRGNYGGGAYQQGYDRGYREGYDRNRRNNRRGGFGWPLPF